MVGNLVIVESPAKAGTIQKYLGEGYKVMSSKGHIRDLHDNALSIDIENGFKPEYIIPADKKKLVTELRKAAEQADIVWLASDEDREGEAISWHLCETLGLKKEKTRRITFHEITKPAILAAIENPRDVDMNLVNAQQARRVLDRLVGFELSPVLWRKIQPRLSAGRVQSVALRLIVDREREILTFEKEPFYRVEASFHPEGTPARTIVKAVLDHKFKTIEEARSFLTRILGAKWAISEIDEKEGLQVPSAPFTTSTLQQEASRKLHLSASQTMSIAQKLYEHGLITYMRTDSVNLSSLAINTAKEFIVSEFGAEYSTPRQYRTRTAGAQEAHEAIRPTFISRTSIEGTPSEKKLYDLIWKRTVASQMAAAKVMKTDIRIASSSAPEKFTASARTVLFDGFLKVYLEGSDDDTADAGEETTLPMMAEGLEMIPKAINAECKFTQAPQRYSEATLIKKLEELEIGRPSTYAPTLTTLTKGRGYIARGDKEGEKVEVTNLSLSKGLISETRKVEVVGQEKGKLLPQDIGLLVSDYLVENFSDVMDYKFTANVESLFDRIADGEALWVDVIKDFYYPFHKNIDLAIATTDYSRLSREIGVDPADGQPIVAKYGQFGSFVQKGDGPDKVCASLAPGQTIESLTLEEALKLFTLPRKAGSYEGIDIICKKGKFGPYISYGDKNISLPKGTNPVTVSEAECVKIIKGYLERPAAAVSISYEASDIQVIEGIYGPYIKHAGANYKIPKGLSLSDLTEAKCLEIISGNAPTAPFRKKNFKKQK
ncbi:MAG: type I DNA topoisomerase [Bacteroidales bacterium]|nr:type I DNA topoisomerase [Bacteroidales bacterium]